MSNNRHVVPHKQGFAVQKPGSSKASSVHATQKIAVDRAKQIVTNLGGGEVVTHRPNGVIRDSTTVGGGNDPCPPRDQK